MPKTHFFVALLLTTLFSSSCSGDIIVEFSNGGALDGDAAGDTAQFTDSISAEIATLTSQAVLQGATPAVINENSGALGVGNAIFEVGEIWSFSWNVATELEAIDLSSFTNDETFQISSTSWQGLSFDTSSVSELAFNSTTGTFNLTAGTISDQFDFSAVSGAPILLNAGAEYSFSATAGSTSLQSMRFSAVPEPSALGLLGLSIVCLLRTRPPLSR